MNNNIECCNKCGDKLESEDQSDHTCPYASDINGDYESLCNCCDKCYHNCCSEV